MNAGSNGLGRINLSELQEKMLEETLESLESTGQAGLHLFTGGGKSYIAHELVKNNYADKTVLWLYPGLTLDIYMNTAVIGDLPNVIPMMYSTLKTQAAYIKQTYGDKIGLIIFDECQRALASQTYPVIEDLLNSIETDVLAMSATPIRDFTSVETNKAKLAGRINSMEVLVPDANYNCYDNSWAIKNNVMSPFEYVICPLSTSAKIFSEAEKLKELLGFNSALTAVINQQLSIIKHYNNSLEDNLYNTLKDKLADDSIEGSKHFVYVNRIDTIKGIKDTIYNVFGKVYTTKNINVYTCYNGQTEADENQANFIRKPVDGEVDILITVNKGGEGLHPENTKSVTMLRRTNSEAKWIQQSNRATSPVEFSQGSTATVFDFVGNIDRLGTISTYMGDMVKSYETYVGDTNEHSDVTSKRLMSKTEFSKPIVTLASTDLAEALSRLGELVNLGSFAKTLSQIAKLAKQNSQYTSIGLLLKDLRENKYYKWFKEAQAEFLSKTMGIDRGLLFMEKLGIRAYYLENTSAADIVFMNDLIKLGNAVKSKNFDTDEISKRSNVYKVLAELRNKYIRVGLSVNIRELSRDLGIDLEGNDGWYIGVIKAELPKFYDNYKNIKKALALYNTKLESEELSEEQWLKIRSKYDYMWCTYKRDIERLALKKLGEQFKDLLSYMKVAGKSKYRGEELINKRRLIRTKQISVESEQSFFEEAERIKSDISKYETYILKAMGYSSIGQFRTILCNCGQWGAAYNSVIKGNSVSGFKSLITLWTYNAYKLTKTQKEMLDSDEFLVAMAKILKQTSERELLSVFSQLYNLNKSNMIAAKCIAQCTDISTTEIFKKCLPPLANRLFNELEIHRQMPDNFEERAKQALSDEYTVNIICACKEFGIMHGMAAKFTRDMYNLCTNKIDGRVIRGMKHNYESKLVNTMVKFNGE